MPRSALKSAAAKSLLRHLNKKSTGRIAVGAGASEVVLYVMQGDIVAAEAGDDTLQILRRLRLADCLTPDRIAELEAIAERAEPVMGYFLDEMPSDVMDTILADRFKENVCQFVGSIAKAKFASLPAIWVDNIQMGHDSKQLVKECASLYDLAYDLDLDAEVVAGTAPDDEPWATVFQFLDAEPRTVNYLLHVIPMEPVSARAAIMHMIKEGGAVLAGDDDVDLSDMAVDDEAIEPDAGDEPAAEAEAEATETEVQDAAAAEEPGPEADSDEEDDGDGEPTEVLKIPTVDDEAEEADTEIHEEESDDISADETVQDLSVDMSMGDISEDQLTDEERALLEQLEAEADAHEEDLSVDAPVEEDEPSDVGDDEISEEDRQAASGAGDLSSLNAWLSAATDVGDDELDAFGDNDYDRGSLDQGQFTTELHNLDKVEVADMEDEVLEADEAPTAKFSAPVLEEEAAMAKIDVAQTALRKLVEHFDAAEGAGRGQAVVQLLVDGSPARFTPLLQDLVINEAGELPAWDLLDNLYARPPTEHRRLLNQTLIDVIERGLSVAADELPDEAFDDLLESIAGYRQKIGF